MKRTGFALLLGLLLLVALPSQVWARGGGHHGRHGGHQRHHFGHHGHHQGRFFFGGGPALWWGPPWWYRHAFYPRTVFVEEPIVYIERTAGDWWYYCESAGAYYPSVESCPEPWMKVAPRPE